MKTSRSLKELDDSDDNPPVQAEAKSRKLNGPESDEEDVQTEYYKFKWRDNWINGRIW